MRITSLVLAVLVLGLGAAEVAAQDTTAAPAPKEQKKPRKNPDVITHEELQTLTGVQTAYDAVKRLRPNFFNVRSSQTRQAGPEKFNPGTLSSTPENPNFKTSSAPPMQLYVNGSRMGGVDFLRGLPFTALWEVRKLNGTDASLRFGADHESGAILVTTGTPPAAKP
ncbi:MAG TPA: hypothetical protein VF862_02680 [Gemmatimonadales bacterium]